MAYGEATRVPIDRSKSHIEQMLIAAGAEGYHTGWQGATADDPGWDAVEFLWKGRQIRFKIPRQRGEKMTRSRRRTLPPDQIDRMRWRVLFLVIKAKLEAVEAGVAVFEEEFMSFIVTSSGRTVGEVLLPRLQAGGQLQLGSGD